MRCRSIGATGLRRPVAVLDDTGLFAADGDQDLFDFEEDEGVDANHVADAAAVVASVDAVRAEELSAELRPMAGVERLIIDTNLTRGDTNLTNGHECKWGSGCSQKLTKATKRVNVLDESLCFLCALL